MKRASSQADGGGLQQGITGQQAQAATLNRRDEGVAPLLLPSGGSATMRPVEQGSAFDRGAEEDQGAAAPGRSTGSRRRPGLGWRLGQAARRSEDRRRRRRRGSGGRRRLLAVGGGAAAPSTQQEDAEGAPGQQEGGEGDQLGGGGRAAGVPAAGPGEARGRV